MAIALMTSLCLSPFFQAQSAHAVTGSDWRAGNIMDDDVFTDKKAMSVSQIQSWLNKRLANCDYYGKLRSEISGGKDYDGNGVVTRAEYARTKGLPTRFTCLNMYYEVPKTTPSTGTPKSNYGVSTKPVGSKSSAQLIYDAAQAYNISPKVLLVKLGTESAGPLTSDTWPLQKQYTYAMGARCPDSGPGGSANCDPKYSGFSIQMREAAALMRWYLDGMDESWWSYKKPYATNNILWNVVERGCGGSNVYIQNKATAALYTYTPYQPNKAALRNMYGTGDNCSAYGNRNFWRVYNDWFGSTSGTPFFTRDGRTIYVDGGDGTSYYHVPNEAVFRAYGYGLQFNKIRSVDASYTNGKTNRGALPLAASFGDNAIYAVADGGIFHFPDEATYRAYGFDFGDEAKLSASWLSSYWGGKPMTTMLQASGYNHLYNVSSGKKRHIVDENAYKTMGSPAYINRRVSVLSVAFAESIRNGAPIMSANSFVRASDTRTVYFWNGSTLVSFTNNVNLSQPILYTAPASVLTQLSVQSQPLGRYVKSSNGSLYALDTRNKYTLTSADAQALGVNTANTPAASDGLLATFTTINPKSSFIKFSNEKQAYKQTSGVIYKVADPYDFVRLGGAPDYSNLVTVPQFLSPIYENAGYQFSSKRLVRVSGDSKVYISDTSFNLHHIHTEKQAEQYGIKLTNIAVIPALTQASAYTVSPNGLTRFVKSSSGVVWLVDSQQRYQLSSGQLSSYFNVSSTSSYTTLSNELLAITVDKGAFSRYAIDPSNRKAYKIEAGKKRWYTSEAAVSRDGATWSQFIRYSPDFFISLPSGTPLN